MLINIGVPACKCGHSVFAHAHCGCMATPTKGGYTWCKCDKSCGCLIEHEYIVDDVD